MTNVKPARFRIYPERKSLYFAVTVWPDKTSMLAYLRGQHLGTGNCTAICSTHTRQRASKDGQWRTLPEIGEINCFRGGIGTLVLAHECGHAALGWAHRVGLDPMTESRGPMVSAENERFAGVVGELIRQFTDHGYRINLWK